MNKSYILTALGVVGSSLLTINANADTIYMCKACKAGTYANNNKCETCPAGSYCIDGVKHPCEAGTFSNAGASSCTTCSAGTYSDAGTSSCKTCEAGYSCNNGTRTACPAGKYSGAGATSCLSCSAGTYSYAGDSSCRTCPAGQYCPNGKNTYSCETRYYYGGCSSASNADKYKHERYSKTVSLTYSLKGSTSTTKIKETYYDDKNRVYWDYFYNYENKSPYKLTDKASGQPYCLFCDPITGEVTLKKNTNQCK